MKRESKNKKLTLHKEILRRPIPELTAQQLAKVLGGTDNGPGNVKSCPGASELIIGP